ncbi:hypothetical protein SYNPS1DRAFT_27553 [Syncephalis pseudoplumigaleata]|uniref:Uncharacterized protein n=1 Tax=Syncephalis pseudoplumigaleata TaxID=1712513 RepID=A0A4V1J1Z4_9FUNG|nr:hypothetical protein SYNPS1DRAFT_27553 [Syncephalis pseudoplumigaleata]|eukprot:RKP26769.1 hypothetical protein SYNPS1DRAFT_27553 [Syncephalis pseudoplumigaleata]
MPAMQVVVAWMMGCGLLAMMVLQAALIDVTNASEIMRILAKHRKPLVGHNCLLDMGHVMQHLWDDLPKSIDKWKHMVFELTTRVHYHEAGYDAYCTGLNLVRMLYYIGKTNDVKALDKEDALGRLLNEACIVEVTNKIFVMRSELNCMDLTGYDVPPEPIPPPVPAAFLLTGVPRVLDAGRLVEILSSLGAMKAEWLANNQCRVTFKDAHVVSEGYVQSLIDSSRAVDMAGTIIFMEKEEKEDEEAKVDGLPENGAVTDMDTIGTYNPLKRPRLPDEDEEDGHIDASHRSNDPEEGEIADDATCVPLTRENAYVETEEEEEASTLSSKRQRRA